MTLMLRQELTESTDRQVTGLSILDAVAALAETRHVDDERALAEHFRAAGKRLREMYAAESGSGAADGGGGDGTSINAET